MLIASSLIVAVRTAKWPISGTDDHTVCDVDEKLDNEVEYAVRLAKRVLHEVMRKHGSLFPQRMDPVYEAGSEDDVPK